MDRKIKIIANIAPLFILILIDGMLVGLIMPMLPKLFIDGSLLEPNVSLKNRYLLYSIALSLFPLFMLLGAPILGASSDIYGRKKILLICTLLTSVVYFIFVLSIINHSVVLFLFSCCVAGCIAGNLPIAQAAMIDISKFWSNKFTNISLVSIAGSLGFIFGPLLAGMTLKLNVLSKQLGIGVPFALASLLSMTNALILYFCFSETASLNKQKNLHLNLSHVLSLSKKGLSNSTIRSLAYAFFCGRFCWLIYFQSLTLRLNNEYHFSTQKLSIFFAYIGVCVFVGIIFIIPQLSKLKCVEKIAMVSLSITLLLMIMSGVFHNEYLQWIVISILPIVSIIFDNSMLHLFSDVVNEEITGWVMGIVTGITSICSIIAGMLSGTLSYVNIFLPILTGVIIGALGLLLIINFAPLGRFNYDYNV